MEKKIIYTLVAWLVISAFFFSVSAAEEEEILFQGFELEKILMFLNAFIALVLFILTAIAYKRDGRNRLLFISLAFLLFSVKSFLLSSELFIQEIPFLDPVSVVLEFLALMSFFYGVIKK